MNAISIDENDISVEHLSDEQNLNVNDQKIEISTQNQLNAEEIGVVNIKKMHKPMNPTPLQYSWRSTHRTATARIAFSVFAMTVIIVAVLIVCLTTETTSKPCQLSFKALIDASVLKNNSDPHSVAAGDFNHDIFIDLVIANSGASTIGIFLNYGNGTFASQITFSTGDSSQPLSVAVGDLNNDTHLDVAVTIYDTHNIGIFLGHGDGTFASQITFSTGASRPVSLAIGDVNNDHWLDIVVANKGTNDIGILFGYGNGSFANQITYSTAYDSFPCCFVLAHFNNDHYLDIAVANYGTDNIGIFLGDRNGSFTAQTIYSTDLRSKPSSIATDDLNNDGQLDIAVANSATNNVGILFGYGNGSFRTQTTYSISPQSNPQSIIISDFNDDNQLDIAVSNYDTNNVSILNGYGNGSFATPTMHSTGIDSGPLGMTVGDFDNDTQSDIALVNINTNNVLVLIGYEMVQSDNPPSYSTGVGSLPYQIVSGDFDNDTQLDLVVANSGTNNVGVFLGYGNGSFQEQITYSTGNDSNPYALAVTDLDNDHRLDIVIANSDTQSVGILYGYGNGAFAAVITHFTGNLSSPQWVIVGNFNNDHHLDIAFADLGTNSIGIILGYGNRTFGNVMIYSSGVGSRPTSIAVGDFNNDGQLDIAVACYGAANIVIFLGSGDGTFTLFAFYSTGDASLPAMLTIADLNKDSHLDVIVANTGTNNICVFFGFGNGSFDTQLTYSTGLNSMPYWISVADLNNDHSLDLAVANANLNNVGVFLGDGYGSFGIQTTYSTGSSSSPNAIAVGDFNKDNRLDIATANYGTKNVAILLGHSTEDFTNKATECMYTISQSAQTSVNCYTADEPILLGEYYASFRSQTVYSSGSSSLPYSLAVGNLNNDTQMDLIVANSGNANLGILLGYGNGTFANEMIYSLDNGSNPQNVISDDFNKDNLSDVAVTNPRNDNIIILLAAGHGTFSTELTYSTGSGSNPSALTIGHLNSNSYLDLVVANNGTDTIGIFFGFDFTGFARQQPCESGQNSFPTSVGIADFNNDGHSDITAALYDTNNVGVFLGYGNGTFTSMTTYAYVPASHPWSVAVDDFNNDKQLDMTIASWGVDSISVVLGYGNGSFTNPILYPVGAGTRPVYVTVGDFNNDSCLDITTANFGGNSIGVFFGNGNGAFQSVIILSTGEGSSPNSVTAVDINNDSQLDIIVVNTGTNNVGIFLGYGNRSFSEQMTFATGIDSAPYSAIAGDFNKDGRMDLAIANGGTRNVGILFGYGNGTFGNLQMYSTGIGSSPTGVNVADFNNDYQLDIIVTDATSTNVGVFFGYGDGTFTSMSIISIGQGSSVSSVAIADFNNDSRFDFAIADNGNNNIGVYLASGSKPFGGQTLFSIGEDSRPSSVAVGHFNDDNHLDIAIANFGTDNIGILLGCGNRLFSNITTYWIGDNSKPMSLAIGDFNNDSRTDIVVANSGTDDIVVLIGYGNGSFSSFTKYSMGASAEPVSVAVGHFNRDNQLDIALANFGTNNVCILYGCGNGVFTNQTWYSLGYDSRPKWIVAKDLNNDGRDDIAVVTYGTGNIYILLNIC